MAKFSELDDQNLVHKMLESERALVAARFKHSMNQLENTASLRVFGRDVARIRTEIRAREIANELRQDELLLRHQGSYTPGVASGEKSEGEESGGFLKGIVDKLSAQE